MKVTAQTKAKAAYKDKEGKDHPAVAARGPVSVDYDIPDDIEGQRKKFGDAVVGAASKGSIVISLQAFVRRNLEKGSNAAAIQAEVAKWRPDVKTIVRQSALEKASSAVEKMSPTERAELLKKLQGMK